MTDQSDQRNRPLIFAGEGRIWERRHEGATDL
jgi:hypothetical protein